MREVGAGQYSTMKTPGDLLTENSGAWSAGTFDKVVHQGLCSNGTATREVGEFLCD